MPQVCGHFPPAPKSLYPINFRCTNRSGNINIQPKSTTTHRPQPHTCSPLRSMAIQKETITTYEHPSPSTYPYVGKSKSTPYSRHKYSYIADGTMYINHTMLAAYHPIRGTGALLLSPRSPHRHDPTSTIPPIIWKTSGLSYATRDNTPPRSSITSGQHT